MLKINPQWVAYNNFLNEGGEGYNPHQKWIAAEALSQSAKPRRKVDNRMLRDETGNYVEASKLAARLAKDQESLQRIVDAAAREIVERRIAYATAQLGV